MKQFIALALLLIGPMASAIEVRAVRLQAPATNTTQDYTISGFGTVQAALIFAGTAGIDTDVDDVDQSLGCWDGTSQLSWNNVAKHGIAVASNHSYQNQSASNVVQVLLYSNFGTVIRSAVASNVTDGIRLTWAGSDTSEQPYVIAVLFNDINGAVCGSLTPSGTDTGTATESSMGITPKVIFGGQNERNIGEANLADFQASFGFAYDTGAGYAQRFVGWEQSVNAATNWLWADTTHVTGEEVRQTTAPTSRQAITNMASGEFTITSNGIGADQNDFYYLALDFDEDAAVFTSQVPTTDVDWVPLSGGSFTPGSALMLSTFSPTINSRESDNNAGFFGIYVATGDEELSINWANDDAAATNTDTSGRTASAVLNQDDTAGTPDFSADTPIFASGSITYDNADVDEGSIAAYTFGIAFEASAATTIAPLAYEYFQEGSE